MDEPATPQKPLTYEETPIIEPIKESVPSIPLQPQILKKPSFFRRFFGFIGNLILFVLLFGVGIWLSTILRQFVPTGVEQESTVVEKATPTPTPTNPTALWTQYQVLNGATKQPFAGVSFKLPPEVLAPVCDGASCASQGTYLPGGTRLTASIRGTSLSFMQRAIITDAAGRPFTTREATISGSPAIEYTGSFRGTTTGGYTFTQMRGYMIEASDTQTLELNHFTPAGLTSDFTADDIVFDKILETLVLPLDPTPTATTSGY